MQRLMKTTETRPVLLLRGDDTRSSSCVALQRRGSEEGVLRRGEGKAKEVNKRGTRGQAKPERTAERAEAGGQRKVSPAPPTPKAARNAISIIRISPVFSPFVFFSPYHISIFIVINSLILSYYCY